MSESAPLFNQSTTLEGTDGTEMGGLTIRKKASDHTFKKPMASNFGLDKLAEKKRRERSQEPSASPGNSRDRKDASGSRHDRRYRAHEEETPTYTGGVNEEAQKKLERRMKRQRLDAQDRKRRDRERSRSREEWRDRSERSDRYDRTPRFRDEPRTPQMRGRDATSRSNWDDDDDDNDEPPRRSTWDHPTPKLYGSREHSVRSEFTPSYKYNSWNKEHGRGSGATPAMDGEERAAWEEEQRR